MVKEHPDQEQKMHEESEWETLFSNEDEKEWEEEKKRRQKRKSLTIKIGGTLITIALLVSGLQIWFHLFNIPAMEFVKVSQRLSQNTDVKQYKRAVVTIEWDHSKGTGFNIDENGLIITNEHVVENANKVNVYFKSEGSYIGTVVAAVPELDLAVIDIEADDLPTLPLSAENWREAIGENMIFIGNPLMFTQIANEGTIEGEILLKDWDVPVMMLEAPIYKGNSGSPVINQNGEVVGVVFATISSPEKNERIGVAVPSYYLFDILKKDLHWPKP